MVMILEVKKISPSRGNTWLAKIGLVETANAAA